MHYVYRNMSTGTCNRQVKTMLNSLQCCFIFDIQFYCMCTVVYRSFWNALCSANKLIITTAKEHQYHMTNTTKDYHANSFQILYYICVMSMMLSHGFRTVSSKNTFWTIIWVSCGLSIYKLL